MGLTLIRGAGLSNIGKIGKLREVTQDDTAESLAAEQISFLYSRVAFYWKTVADKLTLRQYRAIMGSLEYETMARKTLKVSKDKTVVSLCNEILFLCDQANKIKASQNGKAA